MTHGGEMQRTASQELAADLILYNGNVLTLDGGNRRFEAIAVRDGTILALGSSRDVLALAGAKSRLLDLAGRTALPGFIETHNHPLHFGAKLRTSIDANTPPNDSIDDILERIAERVAETPKGQWIRADQYDDTLLREKRHPTRYDLDRVAPDHPVYLTHVSYHFCVANSVALGLAGVTAGTPDPPGGRIFRDAAGEPTGVLAEHAAQALVSSHLPQLTLEDMISDLAVTSREYVKAGITSTHDLGLGGLGSGGPQAIAAYGRAIERGVFAPRVYAFLAESVLPELGEGIVSPLATGIAGLGNDRFRLGGVKMWADGSIQGLTGSLLEPYHCAPHSYGLAIYGKDELVTRVAALREAGWHVATHGNGDAAIEAILEAYIRCSAIDGDRYRIEHCQMARDDQLDRMAEHGIHTSFFVKHVYYWGDRHRDIFIGPQRAARIDPLASAKRRGLRFGLHSDSPITPIPPLEGMWSATNRITRDGAVLGPDECVDTETALRAYTSDAAYLSFEESCKGTLELGKFGDITVLSSDPLAIDPKYLKTIAVETTIVGGKVVYDRAPIAGS